MEVDARIDRLDEALGQLAAAQARTEARVEQLDAAITRLAEAQARTEARLERLGAAVQALTQQVGRLAETIGFTLEDLAREVAPAYLAHHCGIHVRELERRFIVVEDREIEVDLYGEGRRDGEAVVVVGEVRSRAHGRDVEAAFRQARRVTAGLPGTLVPVLFGFVIHPSAREAASRLGAIVISSSGR